MIPTFDTSTSKIGSKNPRSASDFLNKAGKSESQIGLELFFTDSPGIGGRLRVEPEDFIVEEISTMPEHDVEGQNTAVIVRARYWETNRLVRQFARQLRISRKKIMFAGTKDKRAISTQLFVFAAPMDDVRTIKMKDIKFLNIYPTKKNIGLGDLIGNKFSITLKNFDIEISEAMEASRNTANKLDKIGGFPNYFGVQRFGAVRPITHLIGMHMSRGEPDLAVRQYLCAPGTHENNEATQARIQLGKTGDYAKALHDFPENLSFEKAILNHLVVEPEDYIGALSNLPQNLLMMFIHAYQSYLFNKILSERMRRGLPLNEPVVGDQVLKMDKNGLPDHNNWLEATEGNIPKLTELIGKKKAFISATLYGHESEFAKGEMGDIETSIIEKEGVKQRDFVLSEYYKLGSKGKRREILAPAKNFEFRKIDNAIQFDFELNKGCYATTFLREFMKADELTNY
ncbi:MAG: tRNA pseudouridine(13) synthase TruD [Thermoplasmata archaeon]|nr:tRNA pseudouridine(13) synthase TruD [Thermoplasmata archaeon]